MTNTSVIFCHYLGLFVTTVIFCHYLSLFGIICHSLGFFVTFLSWFVIFCHFYKWFVTIWDYLSLFGIFCHFYILLWDYLSLLQTGLSFFVTSISDCHYLGFFVTFMNWFVVSYNLLKWQKMTNQFIKVTNNLKPIYEYKLDFHSLSFSVVKGQFIMGVGLGVGTLVCWCGNFMSSLFRVWHFKCHP